MKETATKEIVSPCCKCTRLSPSWSYVVGDLHVRDWSERDFLDKRGIRDILETTITPCNFVLQVKMWLVTASAIEYIT